MIELVKPPVEAKIIEEVKPPPPPEPKLPPPPKMQAPPPPYIPPPEVQVQTPPPVATITTQSSAPPQHQDFERAVAPAPVATGPKGVAGNCSNVAEVKGEMGFPVKASRAGISEGHGRATWTVVGGAVTDLQLSTSNRLFDTVISDAAHKLKCQDGRYAWEISFKLED